MSREGARIRPPAPLRLKRPRPRSQQRDSLLRELLASLDRLGIVKALAPRRRSSSSSRCLLRYRRLRREAAARSRSIEAGLDERCETAEILEALQCAEDHLVI
jgi:hypothetical protein